MTMILQDILSDSRDFFRSYGEVPSQALMYVNQKLACDFSGQSSNRLSKKDLIMMQILIESHFPLVQKLPKKLSQKKQSISCIFEHEIPNNFDEDVDYFGDTESEYESETTSVSPQTSSTRSSPPKKQSRDSIDLGLEAALDDVPSTPSCCSSMSSSFLLFLEGSHYLYSSPSRTPSCVRVIKITDSVLIVIISELSSRFIARSIHSVLSTLNKVLYSRQDFQGSADLHDFSKAADHLRLTLERRSSSPTPFCSRHRASPCLSVSTPRSHRSHSFNSGRQHHMVSPPGQTAVKILRDLKDLLSLDIKKYCNSFNRVELPTRIDALCSSVCSSLRSLYNECVFLTEINRIDRVQSLEPVRYHLMTMQSVALNESSVYIEYLTVKSQINMTVDPYISIIPGLKGFLYTDRKLNTLVYAFADSKARESLGPCLQSCFHGLMAGKLIFSLQLKDVMAFYFMWFEDLRGKPLAPSSAQVSLAGFPCIMNFDYVSQLRDELFPCRRKDSLCLNNRDTISCHEMLVMIKQSALASYLPSPGYFSGSSSSSSSSSSSTPPTASHLIPDIEFKCRRLAGRLQELIHPEVHYLQ